MQVGVFEFVLLGSVLEAQRSVGDAMGLYLSTAGASCGETSSSRFSFAASEEKTLSGSFASLEM